MAQQSRCNTRTAERLTKATGGLITFKYAPNNGDVVSLLTTDNMSREEDPDILDQLDEEVAGLLMALQDTIDTGGSAFFENNMSSIRTRANGALDAEEGAAYLEQFEKMLKENKPHIEALFKKYDVALTPPKAAEIG